MTVPKRRITTPERQLAAVATLAQQLAHQWDTYTATASALAPPLVHANTTDTGRGSGHGDPTPHLAIDQHRDDTLEAIGAWLAQGRWIAQRVFGTLAAEGPTTPLADSERRAALCADPICAEYAVKAGHCLKHYNAAYYARRTGFNRPTGDSTEPVLETGTLDPSAPTTVGTCGRCQHQVHGHTIEHVQQLLDEHHANEHTKVHVDG